MIETWKNEFMEFVDSLNLSRDDYKAMMEYIDEIPAIHLDHTADIGKKVSISCGRENDLISRQEALKELAVYIHLIDKTMGKGFLTDDDCMEAAKSVLGEDEIPAVQPDHVADISKKVCVDTISRQEAIDALDVLCQEHRYRIPGKRETYSQYNEAWQDALDRAEGAIFDLPSAQPEIIRCKDCAHRDEYGCCRYWKGQALSEHPIPTDDYDFCSMAKR